MRNKKWFVYVLLFLILSLGLFLRVYNIDNTPPGIYPDEAANGEDAIRANNTGNYQWFYPTNQGREGLFMNLIALCFKLFGVSILTLKLPAILFSTLTILGTYLLIKELFSKERTALIGAFLVAVSFWSINFGRISFRANMLPFVLVFTFYFLFRALRTRKKLDFVLSGLFFGLGIHTYIAWRISPLILILLLIFFALSRKNFLKAYWKGILIFLFSSLIIASPMLYTFKVHPEYLESRSNSISIFSPQVNQGNLVGTFLRSFSLSLVKYNFWGDQNWRHNYPPYPILDPLTGIAFLFGIIFSVFLFFQKLYRRLKQKIRDPELEVHALLILWSFIMLAPEFLTAEGLPHALRSMGNLPVIFIFSALTFNFFLEKSEQHRLIFRKIILFLAVFSLLTIGAFNSLKYHYFWANKTAVGLSFNKNLTDISKYIPILPKAQEKFVITSYNTLEKLPIWLFTFDRNVKFFYPNEIDKISPRDPDHSMVFFTENNQDAKNELQTKFPNLVPNKIINYLGSVYYV
ncbi:glycosyltransferase family 39 protein, partial [Patescibacteria group bacterium]|nr:glycosyltransferase family 39 protein [Patescibacteria group bacterium]